MNGIESRQPEDFVCQPGNRRPEVLKPPFGICSQQNPELWLGEHGSRFAGDRQLQVELNFPLNYRKSFGAEIQRRTLFTLYCD